MDELVYHLTAPLEGTNTDMIQDYCGKCAVPAIIFLCAVIIIYAQKKNETVFTRRMTVAGLVGAVVIIGATARDYMEETGCRGLRERTEHLFHIY